MKANINLITCKDLFYRYTVLIQISIIVSDKIIVRKDFHVNDIRVSYRIRGYVARTQRKPKAIAINFRIVSKPSLVI